MISSVRIILLLVSAFFLVNLVKSTINVRKMHDGALISFNLTAMTSVRPKDAGVNGSVPSMHMMAIADAKFARRYRPLFEKNERYARRHGYRWHVIGTDSENCTKLHGNYFFRKHCMVAEWMEGTLHENDIVVVFDSDVVPYRPAISLENWTSTGEDIVLYERIWNIEIAAGNYIARNNPRARSFLREWAEYEYEMPKDAYSSYDNGAIHLHVRRVIGLEDRKGGRCGRLYRNLTAKVDNLDPYYEFVGCARQNVTPSRMTAADGSGLTLRLLGKSRGWVVDGDWDPKRRNEFGSVFHHGIKFQGTGPPFEPEHIHRYELNVTFPRRGPAVAKEAGQTEVSCGGHFAPNCTVCIINQETGAWVGEGWCHGDCSWTDGFCVLRRADRVAPSPEKKSR